MRVLLIVVAQVAISVFLTASVMPVLLIAVPALQTHARLGFGLTAGVFAGFCSLLALSWPWRRK